jgi:hypothetical protein
MTSPLVRGQEPGESEFSYGKGMVPPQNRGYIPTNRDLLNAAYQTDPANEGATVEGTLVANPSQSHPDPITGVYVPGDLDQYATPRVRETGPSVPAGIDPGKYNPGHYADGLQDGSGDAWRASLPPNPVV